METTDLKEAVERAAKGQYDSQVRKRALERMKQMSESLQKRLGEVDLVVPLLREVRDE